MTRGEAYTDLFMLMCGDEPPVKIPDHIERLGFLDDKDYEELQNFVADKVHLQWLTGIGVLEAMDHLVDEAINNSVKAFDEAQPALIPDGFDRGILKAAVRILRLEGGGSHAGADAIEASIEKRKKRAKGRQKR